MVEFNEPDKFEHRLDILKKKLNDIYDLEEKLINEFKIIFSKIEQVQEDKELLQIMIMHQMNKKIRFES